MDDQTFLNQLAEKLSKLGTVRPLGFHYLHPYETVPADSIICNGATYSRALYKDFFDYIKAQNWVKTEAEWQEIAKRDNGYCPFYSDGDGSTNFRTPKFAPFMQVAIAGSSAGKYHKAGLPNITGEVSVSGGENDLSRLSGKLVSSGGLTAVGGTTTRYTGYTEVSGNYWNSLSLSASNSNSIYGNSSTVQPESHEWMICVVVAGQATNMGSVDVGNVMSAVAQVQADVGAIPRPNAYVTKTWRSGTDWYRKWSDGWIEQGGVYTSTSNKAISFHIGFSSKPVLYTAPKANTSTAPGYRDFGYDVTNTNFKAHGAGTSGGYECHWLACGY